jgi:hypothetical protein
VPEEYKYKLHQLFWHHGQDCVRCRAGTSQKSEGWDKGCPIDHLVTRLRKTREPVAVGIKIKGKAKIELGGDDEPEENSLKDNDRADHPTDIELMLDSKLVKPMVTKTKIAKPPTMKIKDTKAPTLKIKPANPTALKVEVIIQSRYNLRCKA